MGLFQKIQFLNIENVIKESTIQIIEPLNEYGVAVPKVESDALALNMILFGQRAQSALVTGQTKGNLLLELSIPTIMNDIESCFGHKILSFKYDTTLLVFIILYLESPKIRMYFGSADNLILERAVKIIHRSCEVYTPDFVQFNFGFAKTVIRMMNDYLKKKYGY